MNYKQTRVKIKLFGRNFFHKPYKHFSYMKRSKEAVSQSILALLVLSKDADEPKLIILYYVSCKGGGAIVI